MDNQLQLEEEKLPPQTDYSKLVDGVTMICALSLMIFLMIFIFYSGMWYAEAHQAVKIVSPLPEGK